MSTNNKAINDVVDTPAPIMHGQKNLCSVEHEANTYCWQGWMEVLPNKYTEKSESILYFGEVVMCSYMLNMWC